MKNLKLERMNVKGITLIALIITIVILLLLAGVTLTLGLSDNGIFKRAQDATDDYKTASESEVLSMYISLARLENKDIVLGEPLYDKNLYNGDKWNLVFTDDEKYGTGWNYIAKGTELEEYGNIKNSWLVNTATGEIIKLEEGKYDKLNYEDSVKIKDKLALNIDASNLGDGNWEGIKKYGEVAYDKENN